MNEIIRTLAAPIAWTLLHSMWQGVVIAAVLLVILRLLRHATTQGRYVASCAALATMVLATAVTFVSMIATPTAAALPPATATIPLSLLAALPAPINPTVAPHPS